MKHLYAILLVLGFCSVVAFSVTAQSATPVEYSVNEPLAEEREETIEITGKDGVIYIRTPHRVEVTVYTILGQTVMVRVVGPGVSELKMETRGIYLVKVEGKTQKVAL